MSAINRRYLPDLPFELAHEICSYIAPWCDSRAGTAFDVPYAFETALFSEWNDARACQADLLALGMTCKALQCTVRTLLYLKPCITRSDGLGLLLRTLAARPDLANTVVELHDLRLCVDDNTISRDTQSKKRGPYGYGHVPASLSVAALNLAPNLVSAQLRIPGRACHDASWHFLGDRDPPAHRSLKTLVLSTPDDGLEVNPGSEGVLHERYLANVEYLHINGCMPTFFTMAYGLFSSMTNLTSLTLTRTGPIGRNVNMQQLVPQLLEDGPDAHGSRLKTVRIDTRSPWSDGSTERTSFALHLEDMLDLFYAWRHSITELTFFQTNAYVRHQQEFDLDKLREYTSITSFSTSAISLQLFDDAPEGWYSLVRLLPASIQKLHLSAMIGARQFSRTLVTALLELLEAHQYGQFPNLRQVEVDILYGDLFSVVERETAVIAYRSAGLDLSFNIIVKEVEGIREMSAADMQMIDALHHVVYEYHFGEYEYSTTPL